MKKLSLLIVMFSILLGGCARISYLRKSPIDDAPNGHFSLNPFFIFPYRGNMGNIKYSEIFLPLESTFVRFVRMTIFLSAASHGPL